MRGLWKTREERDKRDEFSGEGTRMSAGNLFHRKEAVKVKDLLVVRGEEGLDGRLRETTDEDLVGYLFCSEQIEDFLGKKVG